MDFIQRPLPLVPLATNPSHTSPPHVMICCLFFTYINYINLQQSIRYVRDVCLLQETVVFCLKKIIHVEVIKWDFFLSSVGSITLILTLKQPTHMIYRTKT